MSSWWRKIAELQGATGPGTGSWERRVTLNLVIPTVEERGSWPRVIAKSGLIRRLTGASWARRLTPEGQQASSWARALFNAGGPAS